MDKKEKLEAFLADYEVVIRIHGIRIGGCGCCSSPFPVETDNEFEGGPVEDHIAHLRSEGL